MLCSERWTVTFLELAANVPELSIDATAFEGNTAVDQEENSLTMVDGGVGVVSVGAETVQEASALCCVGGDFSVAFDGAFALDIDLESDADTLSASYMAEGLRDVINEGTRKTRRWQNRDDSKRFDQQPTSPLRLYDRQPACRIPLSVHPTNVDPLSRLPPIRKNLTQRRENLPSRLRRVADGW